MKVLYSPIFDNSGLHDLSYEFIGDKIIVTYNGDVDEFDFTNMPEGCFLTSYDRREKDIQSTLPIDPVLDVAKENGLLKVRLLKFYSDESELDSIKDWIEV